MSHPEHGMTAIAAGGPIRMGLGLIASWRSMPMQRSIDVCTGRGLEPCFCRVYLVPLGEVTGTGLLFQPGEPVGEISAHGGDSVARACCASQSNRPKPVVGGASRSKCAVK